MLHVFRQPDPVVGVPSHAAGQSIYHCFKFKRLRNEKIG